MKYSEAQGGRIFVLRLEDGDILHEIIEAFAQDHGIERAALIALGGADEGSTLVVGPEQRRTTPVVPLKHVIEGVHEMAGVGTLFPDASGRPILHMHAAGGREGKAVAGCARAGVRIWNVAEVIIWELTDNTGRRLPDPATGFDLLVP